MENKNNMQKYEYQITNLASGKLDVVIEAMADDGWRLVAVDNFNCYWEKEVQTNKQQNQTNVSRSDKKN